ncbi:MAG: hypothetical protein V2I67_00575, partial [Thermoanaerobaculales bacterium]|nr:hypothetical protein [Thermoanaerobaculales bacterium]
SGDFQFSLWDAASGGAQIGATVPVNSVAVADGRFTTSLDFGAAAFDGDARWLEIAVDYPSGTGSPTTLSPRQPLSATPYALQTRGIFVDDAGNVGIGTNAPADGFHVAGSSTFDGGVHIDSGQGIQFPDLSNRIYTDLSDLRFESAGDIEFNPAYDFGVDGDTLIVDSSLNRVGIGTSSPISLLDVSGNASISDTLFVHGNVYSPQFDVGQNIHFSTINGGWIGLGDTQPRLVFDYQNGNVSIQSTDLAIGTTDPDEMLHVENSHPSGRAFLKVETSHLSDWGETGIRFETPQNRWHLRMDDDSNNNLPEGALGLRCNTPGHEIMTWTEDGMVGIGNTAPSAKLDVVGDLELSGAYRGHLGPDNGAPFPRPAYDSGWVAIGRGESVELSHGIGGDSDDYVVDLQFQHVEIGGGSIRGVHNLSLGGDVTGSSEYGVIWSKLGTTSIFVSRFSNDFWANEVRVRIWVVN